MRTMGETHFALLDATNASKHL